MCASDQMTCQKSPVLMDFRFNVGCGGQIKNFCSVFLTAYEFEDYIVLSSSVDGIFEGL